MNDDEIQAQWAANIRNYWAECVDACTSCGDKFTSGSVVSIFGDLDNAAARKLQLCEQCSYEKIAGKAARSLHALIPSATIVFIEEQHKVRVFFALPAEVRARILEGERIVASVTRGLMDLVEAGLARNLADIASKGGLPS